MTTTINIIIILMKEGERELFIQKVIPDKRTKREMKEKVSKNY